MIKLLDCTLRDGGYYPNWDFDKDTATKYFQYIDKLPIEYIEVGYRSVDKNDYLGEYFFLPLSTIKNIKKLTDKKLVLMLNAKDCVDIDFSKLLLNAKEYISLIRIATDPNKFELSLNIAKELKKLGFDVALNIMYISKIDENHEFFNYLDGIENLIKYIYLVDSYGSIFPNDLIKLINLIKSKTDITLGFHGHNNLELAFINTINAIENGIKLVDSTVLGMGRGAGNLKTELILMYLKSNHNIRVDLNSLGKLIETFQPLLEKYKWGTNLAYMVSGSYSLPQKDVMEALEIDRYSLAGIVNHLKHENEIILEKFISDKEFSNCIIVGGGESVSQHITAIKEYLYLNPKTLIIHSTSKYIKLFEETKNIQYFAAAGDEILNINNYTKAISKYILEPSPRKVNISISTEVECCELSKISFIDRYFDSPLTISLQISIDAKIENINLVGFDGYVELKNKKALYLMQESQDIIKKFSDTKELISLTPTKYTNITKKSIYEILSNESK